MLEQRTSADPMATHSGSSTNFGSYIGDGSWVDSKYKDPDKQLAIQGLVNELVTKKCFVEKNRDEKG